MAEATIQKKLAELDEDIVNILRHMQMEHLTQLCIPDGVGKGLAKLKANAPSTYQYLERRLDR